MLCGKDSLPLDQCENISGRTGAELVRGFGEYQFHWGPAAKSLCLQGSWQAWVVMLATQLQVPDLLQTAQA